MTILRFCVAGMALLLAGAEVGLASVALVRDGKAAGQFVVPRRVDPDVMSACEEAVKLLERSTGARLPVVREGEPLEKDKAAIYLGATGAAAQAGLLTGLEEESYRILVRENEAYIIGQPSDAKVDGVRNNPVRWALNRLLEQELGVRFLWPGELGTFVPRHRDVILKEADIIWQPGLMIRNLRLPNFARNRKEADILKAYGEAGRWLENHAVGRRSTVRFGHAFTGWWEQFGEKHPDYFATPPKGMKSPVDEKHPPRAVKLRLSNPEVIEQIAQNYQKAGAPQYYNVCPNDGIGFDLTPETLAWDDPQGQDLQDIWAGNDKVNLTARYVHFWNLLSTRLRKINPEVTLLTYAYWSYRYAPKKTQPLEGKWMVGVVDGWDAYETWKGWREAGARLVLRPNWGYVTAGGPLVYLDELHGFLTFAHQNGMAGFDLDMLIGHWATEGFNYYVMARLMTRPELGKEELIAEYTAAFGAAAPKVRDYLAYWQGKAKAYGYPDLAGGTTGPHQGAYRDLADRKVISANYFHGPYEALPYLYGDEVLEPALVLLDEALALVKGSDAEAAARVVFLQHGLEHIRLMREAVAAGYKVKAGELSQQEAFRQNAAALDEFRERYSSENVMWDYVTRIENRFKSPIRPENVTSRPLDAIDHL